MFPNHEPEGRGPHSKRLVQILYIYIYIYIYEGGPLPPGSWLGNIVNRKPPRGGGFLSINILRVYILISHTPCMYIYDTVLHSQWIRWKGTHPVVIHIRVRVGLSVCIWVCVYVCVHACVCACAQIYSILPHTPYTYVYVSVRVCVSECVRVCVRADLHAVLRHYINAKNVFVSYKYMCVCVYQICVCVCVYLSVCVCVCVYINTRNIFVSYKNICVCVFI